MKEELICNFEQNGNCSLMRPWKSHSHLIVVPCCNKEICPIWQTYLLATKAFFAKEDSQKLQLEEYNFKIDSTGWKESTNNQGITYLENLEVDVCEYVSGVPQELIGQQLFTAFAGIRETEKVGKRTPTNEEWIILAKTKEDIPNLVYAGSCSDKGIFCDISLRVFFWSSSIVGQNALNCNLHLDYPLINRNIYSRLSGFSIRCLVN